MTKIANWMKLADYAQAKDQATDRIIERQSRGNVAVQNGWYVTTAQLVEKSRHADKAMQSIKRSLAQYDGANHNGTRR